MQIPVLGADISLRNWGLARGMLDIESGVFEKVELKLVQTEVDHNKQVRTNSKDIQAAHDIFIGVKDWFIEDKPKAVFIEVPVGSQSANGMKSYGLCVGLVGAFRALGCPVFEVSPTENKIALAGNKTASKDVMIRTAHELYPEANWLKDGKGKLLNKNEHLADAIGAIHAGVNLPAFQNLLKMLKA